MGSSSSEMRCVGEGGAAKYEPNSRSPRAARKPVASRASTVMSTAGEVISTPKSKADTAAARTRKRRSEYPAHRRGQRLRKAPVASFATAARPLSAMNKLSLADDVRRKRAFG